MGQSYPGTCIQNNVFKKIEKEILQNLFIKYIIYPGSTIIKINVYFLHVVPDYVHVGFRQNKCAVLFEWVGIK